MDSTPPVWPGALTTALQGVAVPAKPPEQPGVSSSCKCCIWSYGCTKTAPPPASAQDQSAGSHSAGLPGSPWGPRSGSCRPLCGLSVHLGYLLYMQNTSLIHTPSSTDAVAYRGSLATLLAQKLPGEKVRATWSPRKLGSPRIEAASLQQPTHSGIVRFTPVQGFYEWGGWQKAHTGENQVRRWLTQAVPSSTSGFTRRAPPSSGQLPRHR